MASAALNIGLVAQPFHSASERRSPSSASGVVLRTAGPVALTAQAPRHGARGPHDDAFISLAHAYRMRGKIMHKKATILCLAASWAKYFGEQIFFFSSARSCRLVGNCSFVPAFSSVSLFIHGCSCSCKASGVGLAGWLAERQLWLHTAQTLVCVGRGLLESLRCSADHAGVDGGTRYQSVYDEAIDDDF